MAELVERFGGKHRWQWESMGECGQRVVVEGWKASTGMLLAWRASLERVDGCFLLLFCTSFCSSDNTRLGNTTLYTSLCQNCKLTSLDFLSSWLPFSLSSRNPWLIFFDSQRWLLRQIIYSSSLGCLRAYPGAIPKQTAVRGGS